MKLIAANSCAKILAGTFAFLAHRYITFFSKSRESVILQIFKYIIALVATTALASGILYLISQSFVHVGIAKIVSDIIVVGASFIISKFFIFRRAA
ncbi:MAG: GtrA family protein [Bradyrhizobium sp.]|nr:GtrA family protein [Bradyrhizobium sp.]